jgi:microcystin-dependent protein
MAKIIRYHEQIFGSLAATNQIAKFGSLYAGSPQRTDGATATPSFVEALGNWLTGWYGAAIGGNSPAIEDLNAAHYAHSYQIAYIMQAGIAEWITDATYYIGSLVNVSGVIYISKTDDNLGNDPTTDGVNWKLYSPEPVGIGKDYWGASLPAGYVWASGKTIGNPSSNATERANDDTWDLFSLFWSSGSDTTLPIYTSAGVLSSRGVSAAADWALNKAIAVPDKRGRVSVGRDDLGGTAANRITLAGCGIVGTTFGTSGGEQTHTLTETEMPTHTHIQSSHSHGSTFWIWRNDSGSYHAPGLVAGHIRDATDDFGGSGGAYTQRNITTSGYTATNANTGGSGAHNNVQPSIICNYIIKL